MGSPTRTKRPTDLVLSLVFLAGATWIALGSSRTWSWPLFLWGAGLGVAASAGSVGLFRWQGARLLARASGERRERVLAWRRDAWSRYWRTYLGGGILGLGAGIWAAGVRSRTVDIVATAAWVAAALISVGRSVIGMRRVDAHLANERS